MLGQKQPSKGANVLISNKKDYIQLLFIQLIIQMFILSKKGIVKSQSNNSITGFVHYTQRWVVLFIYRFDCFNNPD